MPTLWHFARVLLTALRSAHRMLGLKFCKLQTLYELRCEENELLLIKEKAAELEDALRLEALEDLPLS